MEVPASRLLRTTATDASRLGGRLRRVVLSVFSGPCDLNAPGEAIDEHMARRAYRKADFTKIDEKNPTEAGFFNFVSRRRIEKLEAPAIRLREAGITSIRAGIKDDKDSYHTC